MGIGDSMGADNFGKKRQPFSVSQGLGTSEYPNSVRPSQQRSKTPTNICARLVVLLSFFFLSSACSAGGAIVVGDSITAQVDSWPSYVDARLMVNAQNGRYARDFTFSHDMKADVNIDTVIYFLGTNDIVGKTPDGIFRDAVEAHMRFLKARGFRVIVVLPAKYSYYLDGSWRVRQALRDIVAELNLESIDLNQVWDEGQTLDTIHPLPALSQEIARVIGAAL